MSQALWFEKFHSILLCGSTCYVKEVSRVVLARTKCGRKKEIACKLRSLQVVFESTEDEDEQCLSETL